MATVHLIQLHKLTDGTKSWCGRNFPEHDADPDLIIDGPSPNLSMNNDAVTCLTCNYAFEAFCTKYPNE